MGEWGLDVKPHLCSFTRFLSSRILDFPIPPSHTRTHDYPTSLFVEDNKFSVVNAYTSLTSSRKPAQNMDWLWKSPTTPKLKLFLWLVWWHRLPTNSFLKFRNITPSDMCPLCNNYVESVSHILRECVVAKAVWLARQIPTHTNHTLSMEAWLIHH